MVIQVKYNTRTEYITSNCYGLFILYFKCIFQFSTKRFEATPHFAKVNFEAAHLHIKLKPIKQALSLSVFQDLFR